MAHVAGVSLVVLQARAGEYHVGGGSRRDDGELVLVKIEDNGRGRVRGHFERCFRTAALQELDARLSESTFPSLNCATANGHAPDGEKKNEEMDRGSRSQSFSDCSEEKQQDTHRLGYGRFFSLCLSWVNMCKDEEEAENLLARRRRRRRRRR